MEGPLYYEYKQLYIYNVAMIMIATVWMTQKSKVALTKWFTVLTLTV